MATPWKAAPMSLPYFHILKATNMCATLHMKWTLLQTAWRASYGRWMRRGLWDSQASQLLPGTSALQFFEILAPTSISDCVVSWRKCTRNREKECLRFHWVHSSLIHCTFIYFWKMMPISVASFLKPALFHRASVILQARNIFSKLHQYCWKLTDMRSNF